MFVRNVVPKLSDKALFNSFEGRDKYSIIDIKNHGA